MRAFEILFLLQPHGHARSLRVEQGERLLEGSVTFVAMAVGAPTRVLVLQLVQQALCLIESTRQAKPGRARRGVGGRRSAAWRAAACGCTARRQSLRALRRCRP